MRRSSRGQRGKPGIPGILDFSQWLPQTVLRSLQSYDETASFFSEHSSDLERKKGDIIKWISRSSKYALNAEKASHDLIELPNKRKALSFKKNRYFTDDILFFPNHSGSYGFFCLKFSCVGHELQTVISNHQEGEKYFHEICVTESEIFICGIKDSKESRFIIQHDTRNWTTLYVEYKSYENITKCNYSINKDSHCYGSFTFDTYSEMLTGFSVGSRFDNSRFLNGDIASFESYHLEKCARDSFPVCLKNLVIKNQLIT